MSSKAARVNIVSIKHDGPMRLDVSWSVSPMPDDGTVLYFAAAAATRGASFDGSGLPFASETQAFQGGSKGRASASNDGTFDAKIALPNAYYAGLGSKYVPPALHVTYVSGGDTYKGAVQVADGVPSRTLTYPSSRTGPEFYRRSDDVATSTPEKGIIRSQQEILFANGYVRNAS